MVFVIPQFSIRTLLTATVLIAALLALYLWFSPGVTVSIHLEPKKKDEFLVGARKGFLWSLLLAVPASFAFYDESFLRAINFDPVTFARTRVPITNAHRIGACLYAFVTAARFIVLPWSLVAGVVNLVVLNRKANRLGQSVD